jgi:phospholipase C
MTICLTPAISGALKRASGGGPSARNNLNGLVIDSCHKQSPLLQAVNRLAKNIIGIREAVYINQTTMLINFDVNFRFFRKNKPELVANTVYTNSTDTSVGLTLNQ